MSDEIPKRIREILEDDEIANARRREGWATGTAVRLDEQGEVAERLEGVWIELFNGLGGAGVFGGVRFMWADTAVEYDDPWDDDGGFEEAYAYATKEAADAGGDVPYWYVESYNEDDVDFGVPAP